MLIEIIDIVKEITGKEAYMKNDILLYSDNSKVEQSIIDKANTILTDYKSSLVEATKISEAKEYLDKTDHKFNSDYEMKEDETEEMILEIKTLRSVAREFIRSNK
jgi:hypothetical protein